MYALVLNLIDCWRKPFRNFQVLWRCYQYLQQLVMQISWWFSVSDNSGMYSWMFSLLSLFLSRKNCRPISKTFQPVSQHSNSWKTLNFYFDSQAGSDANLFCFLREELKVWYDTTYKFHICFKIWSSFSRQLHGLVSIHFINNSLYFILALVLLWQIEFDC